jgi:hypothetical protein
MTKLIPNVVNKGLYTLKEGIYAPKKSHFIINPTLGPLWLVALS